MRRFHARVFDDIVTPGVSHLTSSRYDGALGRFDDLVLQMIVDNADASGDLYVYMEHSSDGFVWEKKNAGVAILHLSLLGVGGGTKSLSGADPSGVPSLAFVRLSVSIVGGNKARVRIYATARDAGPPVAYPRLSGLLGAMG